MFAVVRDGPRELVIRAVDGVVMRVPRTWTDADGVTQVEGSPDEVRLEIGASLREFSLLKDAIELQSVGAA